MVRVGGNMPVNREFRFFVRDADVICFHPYWPDRAPLVDQGHRTPLRVPGDRRRTCRSRHANPGGTATRNRPDHSRDEISATTEVDRLRG